MFKHYCKKVLSRLKETGKSDFLFFRKKANIAISGLDKDASEHIVIFKLKSGVTIYFRPSKWVYKEYKVVSFWKMYDATGERFLGKPNFFFQLKCKIMFYLIKFPF